MNYTSRRSFLSSLALLSAGTVFSSATGFITTTGNRNTELQELWKSFLENQGGKIIAADKMLSQEALPAACKGHTIKAGDHILFEKEGLVAVPCWIYWNNNRHTPSDLIVTFFNAGSNPQKIKRINRFELEALNHLLASGKAQKVKPVLSATVFAKRETGTQDMIIQTSILGGQKAEIVTTIADKQPVTLSKNIIYHI